MNSRKTALPRIQLGFDMIIQDGYEQRYYVDAQSNPELLSILKSGLRVILYDENEIEVEADIKLDDETKRWYAVMDWITLYHRKLELSSSNPAQRDMLFRIAVDANTLDIRRRILIPTHVNKELLNILRPNLRVIVFEEKDFEVEAVLEFDEKMSQQLGSAVCWYALPDWPTIRYYDAETQQYK